MNAAANGRVCCGERENWPESSGSSAFPKKQILTQTRYYMLAITSYCSANVPLSRCYVATNGRSLY